MLKFLINTCESFYNEFSNEKNLRNFANNLYVIFSFASERESFSFCL